MSSVELLDKTRKIGQLLHNNSNDKVVFNDICQIMSECMLSNSYVISKRGKLLGIGKYNKVKQLSGIITNEIGNFIDTALNDRFKAVLSTKENVNLVTLGFDIPKGKSYHGIVEPIYIAGERLGTLFLYKDEGEYDIDDIILCEYATTVVSLEMMRSVTEENEEDNRRVNNAKSAVDTLSATEKKAIGHIFSALTEGEGILVASKIADEVGITRSVIVNALRKLESAGIIETRSAGMRGTYIKVMNEVIYSVVEE